MNLLNRLQIRLMLSFLVVLTTTLFIIGLALFIFLRSRPVPVDNLLNDLALTSLQADFRSILEEERVRGTGRQEELLPRLLTVLNEQETDYRLFVVGINQRIFYDSFGQIPLGEPLPILEQQPLRARLLTVQSNFSSGSFIENGTEWVFVSRNLLGGQQPRNPNNNQRGGVVDYWVATPRPNPTPRLLFDEFGGIFFVPLLRAGVVGLGLAFFLSLWVSRSVAKPLGAIAAASRRAAAGDFDQQVPITGPTEAQQVAFAFNNMTAEVKQAQQAQRDFIANVTHDLRTPLTSIQGFSQAIMDGVADNPAKSAAIINEEAARLSRLVNDLLDIAKIQAGKMQMLRHVVAIDRVLWLVGENMGIKAQQKGVVLHVEVPALAQIAGDGDRLAQVFTNLVDNAIKHTDPGGQVWLRASPANGGIQVEIQDTGEGIPLTEQSRIFERFYQVDKSRNRDAQHGGTGLGLAITAEIIRTHGGRVWLASTVGVGSQFYVWLPSSS